MAATDADDSLHLLESDIEQLVDNEPTDKTQPAMQSSLGTKTGRRRSVTGTPGFPGSGVGWYGRKSTYEEDKQAVRFGVGGWKGTAGMNLEPCKCSKHCCVLA
jgi:hypothetical protein